MESDSQPAASRLLIAAEKGDNDTITELLNQSIPPDVHNTSHFTPLILAAYAGNIAGIKLLLARGANLNAATVSGNNAIMMAAQNGKTETVEYLSGVMTVPISTIRNKTGDTPLMFASKNGHLQTVKLLLQLGAKLDASNSSGMTAISNDEGHVEVLKELLSACSDTSKQRQLLQMQDVNGNTPLHFASYLDWYGGHVKTVEFLLELGASPFIRNRHEKTPAMDITDALPKFTEQQLIQNVTTCRSLLTQKSKELEELSQKHMDDLTKPTHPEVTRKQPAKHKTKHKKNKSASQAPEDKESKDSGINDSELKSETLPEGNDADKNIPASQPNSTIEAPAAKSLPLDIPKKETLSTGKSPPAQKSPTTGKSPSELYSSIVKSTPPSTGTSPASLKLPATTTTTTTTTTDGKTQSKPPITNISSPPGFLPINLQSPRNTTSSNPPTNSTSTYLPPSNASTFTSKATIANRTVSPTKTNHPTSASDVVLLDQALSRINALDSSQASGHALEIAYRDYSDMCTAMTMIHPNAVALDLPVKAILGLGLSELSMEQLGVLEEMHHKMLQAITDAKLEVVRSQERMRLEEQKKLEIALLTNKLRSVE